LAYLGVLVRVPSRSFAVFSRRRNAANLLGR